MDVCFKSNTASASAAIYSLQDVEHTIIIFGVAHAEG